jgi:hypothetical protein
MLSFFRPKKVEPCQFSFLNAEENAALATDYTMEDFVSRLQPFMRFDEEVAVEFAKTAAAASEFLQRVNEIQHKRSIPLLFRGFTSTMVRRIKEMRRAIRDQMPSLLEEFDELKTEVEAYEKDTHHNMWCDAHV